MNIQTIAAGRQQRLKEAVYQARQEIEHSNSKAMLVKLNELIGHEFSMVGQNMNRPTQIMGKRVWGFGYIVTWLGAQYSFYVIEFNPRPGEIDAIVIMQDEIMEFIDMIRAEPTINE